MMEAKTHQPCNDCGSSDALQINEDGSTYCHSCGVNHQPKQKESVLKNNLADIVSLPSEELTDRSINEDIARDIKQSVMAPCCWSGTVYDHGHKQMEQEIDTFVAEGKTKKEILNYYVNIYGERILAAPIAAGFNLFAWLGPLFIAIIGIGLIVIYVRSSKKPTPAEPVVKKPKQKSTDTINDEIEKELEKMD